MTPTLVRLEIPIGRGTRETWEWNNDSTGPGLAEYDWSARLDGDSTHSIGFMLFKSPGATPQRGSFVKLLRAGQSTVSSDIGGRSRLLRDVRPSLSGADSSLVVELRDTMVIALMFARRPQQVTFRIRSPYRQFLGYKVQVQYDGF